MRRRLELFIPIVLLSIAVQLLAPIGAFRAFAFAVTASPFMDSICSGVGASADEHTAPGNNTQHDHQGCCAFCAAGLGGLIAVEPPTPVFITLQRLYQRVSWLEAVAPTPDLRTGSNAQARAPPQAA